MSWIYYSAHDHDGDADQHFRDKFADHVAGTPYEGGYFRVTFEFGPEYPNQPPKCECGHQSCDWGKVT